MKQKILAPSMQDAQQAELRAEMLGIRGDFQQSGRTAAEQSIDQPGEFLRKGEVHMEVTDGQEFPLGLTSLFGLSFHNVL